MVIWSGKAWKSAAPGGGAGNIGTGSSGEFTPKSISGLDMWLSSRDAEASIFSDNPGTLLANKTVSGGTEYPVRYWADSTSNANDFKKTVVTTEGFPTWWAGSPEVAATPLQLNSEPYFFRPSVNAAGQTHYFDAVNNSTGDYEYNESWTIAMVWNKTAAGIHRPIEKSDNTKGFGVYWYGAGLTLFIGSNADGYIDVNVPLAWANNSWHAVIARWDGASSVAASSFNLRTDGVEQSLTVNSDPTLTTSIKNTAELSLGTRVAAGSYTTEAYYFIAMWPRYLSNSEATSLEQDFIKPNYGLIP